MNNRIKKHSSIRLRALILNLSIFIFALIINGCKITAFIEPLDFSLDLLDIEEVIVPENTGLDQKFIITIKGHLPDSSWSFDHFELTLQDFSLTVKPVGKQDLENRATFGASRIPFERDLSYAMNERGTLTITVIGRNKTIEAEVVIIDNVLE